MKNTGKPHILPALAVGMGAFALVLRNILYAVAVDGKGLLVPDHPVELALGVLSGAVLAFLAVMVWNLDGSDAYADNFSPSRAAFFGHLAAAAGILVTVLTSSPRMTGYLGTAWMVLGRLSPVCLVLAGWKRRKGVQPYFALHLVPALFLVLHIINHYQMWCGDSQLQDYIFEVFGSIGMMFFAFYTACFDVGVGKRRRQLIMGLGAIYLLTAELATSRYPWLYLGGILWAMTDLCTFDPKPKQEPKPREQVQAPEQEAVQEEKGSV